MNKYEDALMTLFCKAHTNDEVCEANKCTKDESCLECNIQKAFEKLQELVEKATPKKVKIFIAFGERLCPNCRNHMIDLYKYCPDCGQALDWSDEE